MRIQPNTSQDETTTIFVDIYQHLFEKVKEYGRLNLKLVWHEHTLIVS